MQIGIYNDGTDHNHVTDSSQLCYCVEERFRAGKVHSSFSLYCIVHCFFLLRYCYFGITATKVSHFFIDLIAHQKETIVTETKHIVSCLRSF